MPLDDTTEIKTLIETQGKAFEAFKVTLDEMKKVDGVTADKLVRIEKDLDVAVEAKAQIEARMLVEKNEREALELRLSRSADKGDGLAADEMKQLNIVLRARAAESGKALAADMTGDEFAAYKAAQTTYMRLGRDGHSDAERKAMMVGGDPQGGYLVTPDVSGRMIKRVFETSPIRQIANVTTISTDALEGIEDLNEVGAGWTGETTARPETTTADIGKWRIPVHEMHASPRSTQRLLDDAIWDIEAWLVGKVGDRFARLENAAFVNGDGVVKPRGIADVPTILDAGAGVSWGSFGHVLSGASGAFVGANPADRIFDLIGLLKDAYLPNARFVTRRAVITAIRKFKDSQGQFLWQPSLVLGAPEMLAGYPITRAEDVPALAAASRSLFFGDFKEGYQIVDRAGIKMFQDPYTAKPYVIFYNTKRTGGGPLNYEAIKGMVFSA